MKEKEIKEPKKKGYDLNDLGVDKSNTQPEERSRTRDKSLFPPISELIQKKPFAKDKPPLPDIEKKSIKEDKVREEQEVKDVEIQDSRREEFDKDRLLKQKLLDEYFLESQKYKEGNYQFGNYSTKEQILEEFLKGKIFVLKEKFGVGSWIFTILMFAIGFLSIFALMFSGPYGGFFIPAIIITFPTGVLLLLTIRRILVIGPLGVRYQNLIKIKTLSWNNVSNIKGSIVPYLIFPIPAATAEVKLYLIKDLSLDKVYFLKPKIYFRSSHYRNKEFPKKKKLYQEMFINLFYTYFSLGKNLDI